ncbi:MAG: glycosyl transferase family 2, partial [Eubacterium sp.]|nr:glycosyl transferase family 2 [Eubacterium sp.]
MKIAVYAIAKNEEKFVDRWYNSMKEADEIFVCDTGSKENPAEKLKRLGAKVKRINIEPLRFDRARNESLEFVDEDVDICVCTD